MASSPAVVKFARNERGRDFILGDIHGAFNMVIQGMRKVGFEPSKDRLFALGDLVDRGLESHRVLEFLAKPYVFAIRGNHDHAFDVLTLYDLKILGGIDYNGMGWIKGVSDKKLLAIKKKLRTLPVLIEIETQRGTVGMVHGDVPKGKSWQEFSANITARNEAAWDVALDGRDRIKSRDMSGVAGIDRVFVGHSIQWNGPRQFGNVFAIDTGAIFYELKESMGVLTMLNIECRADAIIAGGQGPIVTHSEAGHGAFSKVFGLPVEVSE